MTPRSIDFARRHQGGFAGGSRGRRSYTLHCNHREDLMDARQVVLVYEDLVDRNRVTAATAATALMHGESYY